jgi:CubicO group peptidase (beta-lactamase class C family)
MIHRPQCRFTVMAAVMFLSLPMTSALGAQRQSGTSTRRTTDVRVVPGRIDSVLKAMVASGRAVGVSALVFQGGVERYFGMAGFADREAQRPMTRTDMMQIYSMTKPVTGVALMQLWEAGKFGLDDPLAQYLPEFADMKVIAGVDAAGAPIVRPASRPILIRDIMRHTAGFSYGMRATRADTLFHTADPLNLANDLTEMGRRLASVPLMFDPGAEWNYSAAVDVQALLVEKLSGVPFESYVRMHVLDPLGMRETGWTQPKERESRFAAMYSRNPDHTLHRVGETDSRALNFGPRKLTMGGAGIGATIDEYMRFALMLLGGGSLDGVRMLKSTTVQLMATDQLDPRITERFFLPTKGSVGFGLDFAVRTSPPKDAAENRGAVGEFFWDGAATTLFWVDPANDIAVVFFTQVLGFDATLHHDIRAAVYGSTFSGQR